MTERTETVREAFLQASSFLQRRGVEDSARAAELLLCHVLDLDRTALFLRWNEPFPERKRAEWREVLARRAAREPVQYITGEQEFFGLPFAVSPAVLIPRPETEILVENIVAFGKKLWPTRPPVVADIGTGSGAIAVTIAAQCPAWIVLASDISAAALEVARGNAARNGVERKIAFYTGDLLEPFIASGTAIDVLVSNPPYIATADIEGLQPEVRRHEPRAALDGGEDGLMLYRRMIDQLGGLPDYPSLIGFEVGQGQAKTVAAMLESRRYWNDIRIIPDLAGIERHVIAIR